jgi:serine palmitoyltransferase
MEGDLPALGDLYRLKKQYQFIIYCDEAHSFLSIGKTGRGCLEYWNDQHPDISLPCDLIDIRTAAFSKAVGCVGGLICGTLKFKDAIRTHISHLSEEEHESLPCSTMVQTLWVLGQPTLTARNLRRLRNISQFCRRELSRYGLYVYGDDAMPIIPIHTGRPTIAAELSYVLRCAGVIAGPVAYPAVGFWKSRIRINLSAGYSDDDVDELVDAIIYAGQSVRACKKVHAPRRSYHQALSKNHSQNEKKESLQTYTKIYKLILQTFQNQQPHNRNSNNTNTSSYNTSVLEAGHVSRALYGLGSGGSRWICGTFSPHLNVETLVAKATGMQASMAYSDSCVGLASTIAALSRPSIGYRTHYMLLAKNAPRSAHYGLRIAPKKDGPNVIQYTNIKHLCQLIDELSYNKKAHLTIYIYLPNADSAALHQTLAALSSHKVAALGMTILFHSPTGILNPHTLAPSCSNIELLVFGSFFTAFGLPGAYLSGSKTLVEELRYTSRGYMFSTSSPPWVMSMQQIALQKYMEQVNKSGQLCVDRLSNIL